MTYEELLAKLQKIMPQGMPFFLRYEKTSHINNPFFESPCEDRSSWMVDAQDWFRVGKTPEQLLEAVQQELMERAFQ
jgi:hypothetical protein